MATVIQAETSMIENKKMIEARGKLVLLVNFFTQLKLCFHLLLLCKPFNCPKMLML